MCRPGSCLSSPQQLRGMDPPGNHTAANVVRSRACASGTYARELRVFPFTGIIESGPRHSARFLARRSATARRDHRLSPMPADIVRCFGRAFGLPFGMRYTLDSCACPRNSHHPQVARQTSGCSKPEAITQPLAYQQFEFANQVNGKLTCRYNRFPAVLPGMEGKKSSRSGGAGSIFSEPTWKFPTLMVARRCQGRLTDCNSNSY